MELSLKIALSLSGMLFNWIVSPKGGFFSENATCFLNLQISKKNIPKNYPELEIQIPRQ